MNGQATKINSSPRGVLSNAGWNAFATLFSIFITFLMAPLLIHHLGTHQWGLLLLVWSVTGVLGMANFGVGEATLRFIARYHADADIVGVNRVLGATLTFYVSICTLISVALFAATPMVAQWVKVPRTEQYPVDWLLRLSALLFTFGMIGNAYRSIPMAMQRYDISSKMSLGQSILRTAGVLSIVMAGMGVLHVVVWEVLAAAMMLGVQVSVVRRLLPGVRCMPSMSFAGTREIFGYGVFSFLTHLFLMVYREAGKLILGSRVSTASVAYLGTPDSIAHRLHTVVVSGIETLMPRFSASRNPEDSKALLVTSTWIAVTSGVVLYLPLAVLMPDFLRLWINAEFARESSKVGQLLALSFIAPSAFSPIATMLRGTGKPGIVTLVMALAGTAVLASSLLLVSSKGPVAVGYGYVFSALAWLGGLFGGWLYLFGWPSLGSLLRAAGLPLIIGCAVGVAEIAFRVWWGEVWWTGLFVLGGMFAGVNAVLILSIDWVLGGDSPAEQVIARFLPLVWIAPLRRRIELRLVR